jgi:galactokinase
MNETSEGLSPDHELTSKELNYLVELTKESCRVHGPRKMEGGSGGCTINFIRNDVVEESRKIEIEMSSFKIGASFTLQTSAVAIPTGFRRVRCTRTLLCSRSSLRQET